MAAYFSFDEFENDEFKSYNFNLLSLEVVAAHT